jgi:hypothetical protein
MLRFIIPAVLMIIFTSLIVMTANKSKKRMSKKSSSASVSQDASGKKLSKESSLTSTVVRMNILFVVLNTPVSIIMVLIHVYHDDVDEIYGVTMGNLYLLAYQLSNIYYSFRLVWNLVFNRLFLDEFLILTKFKEKSIFSSKTSKTLVASRSRAVSAVSHN